MKKAGLKVTWRLIWYCTLVWLLTFILGGIVVLPWYYIVLPLSVLLLTIFYFDNTEQVRMFLEKKIRKNNDTIFALGLGISIFWFVVILLVSLLALANFYYYDVQFYFSDPRNWLLFPSVLLVPVIYSIFLQNNLGKKSRRRHR